MDQQILQKVEFYRREEKRLRLYFDQFCNLLSLKHVLQYRFNQIMWANVLKRHSRRIKGQKGPRSLKISPLWNRNVWPPMFLSIWIDRFCCAAHNLSIHILRTVWGYTILPQKWYCDKWDFAGIRANQNLSIQKIKMGTCFENLQNVIFVTLNLAIIISFLH